MECLVDHLLRAGTISASDLSRAQEVSDRAQIRPAAALVRLGIASEADVAAAASQVHDLELVGPRDSVVLDGLNPRFLRRHAMLPLGGTEDRLRVAMADPGDEDAVAALAFATAKPIERCVMTFSDIADALSAAAGSEASDALGLADTSADDDLRRLEDDESEAPVIRLVQSLLTNAVLRRASDVHIEPMARHIIVRYRIDGRLIEVERHAPALAGPIALRIKVLAGLDIAESRLPQDGRLRLTVRGRDVDVRVATSPTAWGESIVLRLLGRSEVPLDLDHLGLPPTVRATLEQVLGRPHGIILLTGPTGSGKTTTLYAALSRLRRPDVKILTVEDPVEILLEGVNQVQVHPEIDLSYAAALRAFLRQDPDILMIGEIRDQETAEIALRAAMTGHLVLSTLHTNSAIGAFARLADIGVEPYLVSSTVLATIAQRLVRRLCGACTTDRAATSDEIAVFEANGVTPPARLLEPQGCPRCQGTGYAGRLLAIEIVEVDEPLRMAIRGGTVNEGGRPTGPGTLLGHGLALAADGQTSLAEIQRAIGLA